MRVLALVVLLIGCPRDVTEPERPPGTPCTQNSDCTPVGAPCGQIWVCADGVCEDEPSRTEPCR